MKDVVPITSGSTQILGLTRNEWVLQSYIFIVYMAPIVQFFGFPRLPIAMAIHLLILFVLVTLFKKIEQNVFPVLFKSYKIGKVVIGSIERKIPIEEAIYIPSKEDE